MLLHIKNNYYLCIRSVMASSLQKRLDNLFARNKRYKTSPKGSSDEARSPIRAFSLSQTLRTPLIGTGRCYYRSVTISFSPAFFLLFDFLFLRLVLFLSFLFV